jgi:hypothetical protein
MKGVFIYLRDGIIVMLIMNGVFIPPFVNTEMRYEYLASFISAFWSILATEESSRKAISITDSGSL